MEQKSVVKLLQTKESLYVFDAAAEKDILSAEKALALRFAADYREYVSAFGAASYCEHELTGICKSARLNVVDVTQDERRILTESSYGRQRTEPSIEPAPAAKQIKSVTR